MDNIDTAAVKLQQIEGEQLQQAQLKLAVLRLDNIHAVVSGNKWFKLTEYIQEAILLGKDTIASFGGAYSNHIVAVAYTCMQYSLKSIGIIRGEQPAVLSNTLQDAQSYGMQLHFVSRTAYRDKAAIQLQLPAVYWINEGGYGPQGAKGAAGILSLCHNPAQYSHIICAVGTGTMMAGIIQSAAKGQSVIGVSSMKGNISLTDNVKDLLANADLAKNYYITHAYHFGGYAKYTDALIHFMNNVWLQHGLPTDIVYTAKTFYAIQQMILHNTITAGSNVLMIHSGGLQGNRSLPTGSLLF